MASIMPGHGRIDHQDFPALPAHAHIEFVVFARDQIGTETANLTERRSPAS